MFFLAFVYRTVDEAITQLIKKTSINTYRQINMYYLSETHGYVMTFREKF